MRKKLEGRVAAYQKLFDGCIGNEALRVLIGDSLGMAKIALREHDRMLAEKLQYGPRGA